MSVRISLVVATIGRADALAQLFASLAAQTHPPHEVIVVEQGDGDEACAALVATAPFPARHVQLARRGLSRARNAGWRLASGEVIGFPDDDCAYPPDLLQRVAEIFAHDPTLTALSGRTVDARGRASVARTDARSGMVTRTNVWRRCVEPATFIRANAPARFDPRLGVGASTPWQAYEGPELLLRLLARGARVAYRADVRVLHADVLARIGPREMARATGYGRGHGFVLAKHAGLAWAVAAVIRAFVGAAARGLTGASARAHFGWLYAQAIWAGARDQVVRRARVRGVRRARSRAGAHGAAGGHWWNLGVDAGGAALLQGVGMALRYGTALLLAAWLSPVDFGTFAWATSALAVAVWLPTLGFAQAASRFLPSALARGEEVLAAAFVAEGRRTTLRTALGISTLLTAAAVSPWWPGNVLATVIAAWTLPALGPAAFDAAVLRAQRRAHAALIREQLLAPLVTLAGIVALAAVHGASAVGAVTANALGVAVLAVVLRCAAGPSTRVRAPKATRATWRRTGRSLLLGTIAQEGLARADVTMVGLLLGAEAAGVAHLASRTAALLLIVRYAVGVVTNPRLAALAAVGDHAGLARLRGLAGRLAFYPSAALAALLIAVSPTLFAGLGNAYAAALPALVTLAIGNVLVAAFGPVGTLLDLTGGQNTTARAWLLAVPVALVLHALMIPPFGVLGAALVHVTTTSAVTLWLAFALARRATNARTRA